MDKFVQNTETRHLHRPADLFGQPGLVMDYYDGNTVTGLWNYAQNYAMSDNNFDTTFGPSTPGRAEPDLRQRPAAATRSTRTHRPAESPTRARRQRPNANGVGTIYSDPDPAYDDCSDNNHTSTSPLGG